MGAELPLRQVLSEWRFPQVYVPARPLLLERTVREVARRFADAQGAIPDPADLAETRQVLEDHWRRGALGNLPRAHLRRSPHALFLDPEPHLGADREFVRAYLGSLWNRANGRMLGTLLHVFLREYPIGQRTFETLREGLRRLLEQHPTSARLQTWKERCTTHGLLEPDAVQRLASEWVSHPDSPTSYLEQVGLSGELATRGLVTVVFDHLLHRLRAELMGQGAHSALLDPVLRIAIDDADDLRFPDRRAALAEALLLPFDGRPSTTAATESIKTFLTRYYGHPRIKLANWHTVHPTAVRVFLRWNVREALHTFFDVLDATAKASHWSYRKAFWTAYLDRDYIDDAWIFLGRQARTLVSYGLQDAKGSYGAYLGAPANKSILLMRIGGLTIVEQTHDGKCFIWPPNHSMAPRPYEPEYRPSYRATEEAISVIHHGSQAGSWQAKVARHIRDYTGITVRSEAYLSAATERFWG